MSLKAGAKRSAAGSPFLNFVLKGLRAQTVGAVGMWESRSDFQGRWETKETWVWFSSFFTRRSFPRPNRRADPRHSAGAIAVNGLKSKAESQSGGRVKRAGLIAGHERHRARREYANVVKHATIADQKFQPLPRAGTSSRHFNASGNVDPSGNANTTKVDPSRKDASGNNAAATLPKIVPCQPVGVATYCRPFTEYEIADPRWPAPV
jgi:hypothetical protein